MTYQAMTPAQWGAAQHNAGLKPDNYPGPVTFGALFAYGARGKVTACATALGNQAAISFPKYDVMSGARIAFVIAEVGHETGDYSAWEENLHYTAKALAENWPARYAKVLNPAGQTRDAMYGPEGKRIPTPKAIALAAQGPEAIANDCYARPQEGNTHPGDGWKFRGRGANMQTFLNNYLAAEKRLGIPFTTNPDLMEDPADSLVVALEFYKRSGALERADAHDFTGWRHLTNGGIIGLPDFTVRAQRMLAIF